MSWQDEIKTEPFYREDIEFVCGRPLTLHDLKNFLEAVQDVSDDAVVFATTKPAGMQADPVFSIRIITHPRSAAGSDE